MKLSVRIEHATVVSVRLGIQPLLYSPWRWYYQSWIKKNQKELIAIQNDIEQNQ